MIGALGWDAMARAWRGLPDVFAAVGGGGFHHALAFGGFAEGAFFAPVEGVHAVGGDFGEDGVDIGLFDVGLAGVALGFFEGAFGEVLAFGGGRGVVPEGGGVV